MKKITEVYVRADRESMWDKVEKLNLTGEAARNFSYTAYEVKLGIEYDDETGNGKIITVDGIPLAL